MSNEQTDSDRSRDKLCFVGVYCSPLSASQEKAPQATGRVDLCPVLQNTHAHMNERGKAAWIRQTATGYHFRLRSGEA